MKRTLFILLAFLPAIFAGCNQTPKQTQAADKTPDFRLTDLHIHCKGGFTIDSAIARSARENIDYGLAVNCGKGFPLHTDAQIDSAVEYYKAYPQFFLAMQAEGREWLDIFSKESLAKFDYIFTDGMTFTDAQGRRNRIWMKEETWIDDEQEFMNYLVNTIVKIISTEPINIYVNPTYLPEQMAGRYDFFWTPERMDMVINAAKEHSIAIEINNRFRIPSIAFLERAKKAGCKFTIGTNNADSNFSGAPYAIEVINKLGLTKDDFYLPVNKRVNG